MSSHATARTRTASAWSTPCTRRRARAGDSSRMDCAATVMRTGLCSQRLYSMAPYKSINTPLRDTARATPHGLAVTVMLVQGAVKKLRAVGATAADSNVEMVLWRGMAGVQPQQEFLSQGGTDVAPISTTTELKVAVRYSSSTSSVLLRLRAKSFMSHGADISYLSAFPAEREFLYHGTHHSRF
mmetsp:Transcript_30784/g.50910  ORF Transcript_30784/g.50910 Transcript_30784/m.50910 type:complete len:184 (+) Transcript_30784:92-643(+)